MKNLTMTCPHCDCAHEGERGDDGHVAIRTKDCAACGRDLCEECEQFKCDACDEVFCVEHRIIYDGEWICVPCALASMEEASRTLRRQIEERVEARLNGRAA